MLKMTKSAFTQFMGHTVKAPYRDGTSVKVARGILTDCDDMFIKINGPLGTIIINQENIERMSIAGSYRRLEKEKAGQYA